MDINKRSRAELKQYFVKNAIPTEKQFADLIDGLMSLKDDGITKLAGNPLCIEASGDDTSQKKILHLYNSFSDTDPTWVLSLNPRQDPSKPDTAKAGLNISDSAGNSRLFIDKTSGNIGLGTIEPTAKLEIVGDLRVSVGSIRFNYQNCQLINLWQEVYGMGVQGNTTYFRTFKHFAFHAGGKHDGGELNPGGGTLQMCIKDGRVGIGTADPQGMLDVRVPGATGGWDRFLVTLSTAWGDGANQYVTITGGAGTMIWNPHIPWFAAEGRASIRYGRSGGVSSGAWWDAGVRGGNAFSIALNGGDHKLWLDADGSVKLGGGVTVGSLYSKGDIELGGNLKVGGRMHITGDEACFLLHKSGTIISKAWGGNGNLTIEGTATVGGELSVVGAWVRVRGAGNEQAVVGGDGGGNDVHIGSMNAACASVIAYNSATGTAMNFTCLKLFESSDERLKENIETLDGSLGKILQLRCVVYNWKIDNRTDTRLKDIGLVAQEVRQIVPEAVSETRGLLSISYNSITALLINAVQEQQRQIDELRTLVNKRVG